MVEIGNVLVISASSAIFRVIMQHTSDGNLKILDEGLFSLSFTLREENKDRSFQFQRQLQESVKVLLQRITSKVTDTSNKKKKKKQAPTELSETSVPSVPVQLIKDGAPVSSNAMCGDVFKDQENSKITLKVGDHDVNILINYPWVEKLVLPNTVMVGFPAYPHKFKLRYSEENDCEFLWFKGNIDEKNVTSSENSDTPIHSGFSYVPSNQDIGYNLRFVCTPKRGELVGNSVETVTPCVVEAGPGLCPFEVRHSFTKDSLSGESVVSYNILADLYASSSAGREELFTYCPRYAMKDSYRKLLLLKELCGYNADIICLQEVDCKLFARDLKRILQTVDMDGVMVKKGGQVQEGVACFYRKSRLKLVSSHNLLLGDESRTETYLDDIWKAVVKNEALDTALKEKTTCVQVSIFDYLEKPKHKLIVANTHLYFHPEADHIRLLQAGMSLNLVNNIKTTIESQEPDTKVSVIFCGDFNSTPECGVYKLFTENHISENYCEWKSEVFQNETVTGLALQNPINFDSACGTPEFTNFTPSFVGCLDYIFYQTDFLNVEQVVPFPSREEVSQNTAIPSIVFPSDHVALIADLRWK